MQRRVASQRGSLAHSTHTLAAPQPRQRRQDRGLRPLVEGERSTAGQTVGHGGRRLGAQLQRSGESFAAGRLPAPLSQHPQDTARPSSGPPREPRHLLPCQDASAVRVREASPRDRVGRGVPRRPHQRDPAAADLVSAVPSLSTLLPAQPRLVQGQVAVGARERGQAGVASHARAPHQHAQPRETLIVSLSCPCPCPFLL